MSDKSRVWTAGLVVIGDEILSGRTQDRNVTQVATWLNDQGIRLCEVRIVPDVEEGIVAAVNALRADYDYCFTTGGIGSTHDDITVDAVAAAFGVPVIVHPKARAMLEAYYAKRTDGMELTESRLRMARTPDGAEVIVNRASGAPGIRKDNVFILAGVPTIAKAMLEALDGALEGGRPMISRTLGVGAPESDVADLLRAAQADHPAVAIGSYPFFKDGRHGTNLVLRADDEAVIGNCADDLGKRLDAAGCPTVKGGIDSVSGVDEALPRS